MSICELCSQQGGELLFQTEKWRVVLVNDLDYPGFCRVIWHEHVKEMTDLPSPDRAILWQAVMVVEQALRETLNPEKINLASLGNMTPHLHWHVIPRFKDDPHFPQPVWAVRQRQEATDRNVQTAELASRIALLMEQTN